MNRAQFHSLVHYSDVHNENPRPVQGWQPRARSLLLPRVRVPVKASPKLLSLWMTGTLALKISIFTISDICFPFPSSCTIHAIPAAHQSLAASSPQSLPISRSPAAPTIPPVSRSRLPVHFLFLPHFLLSSCTCSCPSSSALPHSPVLAALLLPPW